MDGCESCGMAYSFVFQEQFHKVDCREVKAQKILHGKKAGKQIKKGKQRTITTKGINNALTDALNGLASR